MKRRWRAADRSARPANLARDGGLFVALLFALALVLASPFIGDLRRWLRATFPGGFRWIVAGALALAIGAVVAAAVRRIRDRRGARFGALLLALAIGMLVARGVSGGNLDVDLVEDVHFAEYGVLTFLFYRAWRMRGDISVIVLPMAAALVVAVLDEFLQWFLPFRIGEIRDVWIDAAAIACGLLFSVAIEPPDRVAPALRRGSGARVIAASIVLTTGLAWFVLTIHVGHEIRDPDSGIFRSRYTVEELAAAAADRASRWQGRMPAAPSRFSREDQYLAEGLWHVTRRNRAWSAGDVNAAWAENRVLERHFASVVAIPDYRWPDAQRVDAARRMPSGSSGYVSDANPFVIYEIHETGFPK